MKTAEIPYIERLEGGGLLFHDFVMLQVMGQGVIKTDFGSLVIDTEVTRNARNPRAHLFHIDHSGLVKDPVVEEIIRKDCPNLKTAFIEVRCNSHQSVFYVKSPISVPDSFGDGKDEE